MAKENHLYYVPTSEGMQKIERLRKAVIELDDLIDELLPNEDVQPAGPPKMIDPAAARSKALAKTKLEEARQRAIEAIVRNNAIPQKAAA